MGYITYQLVLPAIHLWNLWVFPETKIEFPRSMVSLCLYASLWLRKIISLISIRKYIYIYILHIKYVYLYIYIYYIIYIHLYMYMCFPLKTCLTPMALWISHSKKSGAPKNDASRDDQQKHHHFSPYLVLCCIQYMFLRIILYVLYIYIYTFMYSYAGCVLRLAQGQNRPGDLCVFASINMY